MRHQYVLALPLAVALLSAAPGLASAAIPGQALAAASTNSVAARAGIAGQPWQVADAESGERSGTDRNRGESDRGDRTDRSHH
jgi:hypothetical protein